MRRPMRRRGRRVENWARRVALTGVIAITYILSGFLRVGGTVHTMESAMTLFSATDVARRLPPPHYCTGACRHPLLRHVSQVHLCRIHLFSPTQLLTARPPPAFSPLPRAVSKSRPVCTHYSLVQRQCRLSRCAGWCPQALLREDQSAHKRSCHKDAGPRCRL